MGNNPKPTGKYAVGTTTFTAKEERDEVLKPGTKRRISARVYYPVMKEAVDGFEKVQYMSRDMFKGLKKAFKLDANLMHENLCKCHLAFFNAHLKNNYGTVDLKSNDVIAYFLHDSYTKRFRKMLTLEQFKDQGFARVYSEQ